MSTSNFEPIKNHAPEAYEVGVSAEKIFQQDPRAAMSHLRVFGERITEVVYKSHRFSGYSYESQFERLKRLRTDAGLGHLTLEHLHTLRKGGNEAVHGRGVVGHQQAFRMLRAAHRLAGWYWKAYTPAGPPQPAALITPTRNSGVNAAIAKQAAKLKAREVALAQREAKLAKEEQLRTIQELVDMPEVATYHTIQGAFEKLTEDHKKQLAGFLRQFREEPIHKDWPIITPSGMADDKVRMVSKQGLSFVVVEAPRGDLLILAHLGTEEQCLNWAKNRRFDVNPILGTLQVYDPVAVSEAAENYVGGLFDNHNDEALAEIGVPKELMESVRNLGSEADLDELSPKFPPEVSDGLYLLASGFTLSQTKEELQLESPQKVDSEDFAVAIHHPESKRSFAMLSDDEDLDAVLSGSIKAWRIYLHPTQRRIVQMAANGPIRVLGGAGTGKTVALLHRARHLALGVYGEASDRMLVTTYTKNLASDLRKQLGELVDSSTLRRFDCVNLHAYISELWRAYGDRRRVVYHEEDLADCWQEALKHNTLDLPSSFYRSEWTQIIQAKDVFDLRTYWRTRRPGRGKPLSKGKRKAIWPVFEAYRHQLDERGLLEGDDQIRILSQKLIAGQIPREYVSVLADEVQDFGPAELKFLRALVPNGKNDLFFVGDAHQRIYKHEIRMSDCGIEIRGRARRLKVNYRTTAKVRNFAVSALTGEVFDDMDGGLDDLKGYRSLRLGVAPITFLGRSRAGEEKKVVEVVESWLKQCAPEDICVAGPTHRHRDKMAYKLKKSLQIEAFVIDKETAEGPGVRFSTFARMKGLEFKRVVLVGVNEGAVPSRPVAFYSMSPEDKKLHDRRQRCQLYVAATRARDFLAVTGYGKPSPFIVNEEPPKEPADVAAGDKRCPRCGAEGPISEVFGYRNCRRTRKDGVVVVVRAAQSYCRECRAKK